MFTTTFENIRFWTNDISRFTCLESGDFLFTLHRKYDMPLDDYGGGEV